MNINTHGITLNAFANICIKIYIKKKKNWVTYHSSNIVFSLELAPTTEILVSWQPVTSEAYASNHVNSSLVVYYAVLKYLNNHKQLFVFLCWCFDNTVHSLFKTDQCNVPGMFLVLE